MKMLLYFVLAFVAASTCVGFEDRLSSLTRKRRNGRKTNEIVRADDVKCDRNNGTAVVCRKPVTDAGDYSYEYGICATTCPATFTGNFSGCDPEKGICQADCVTAGNICQYGSDCCPGTYAEGNLLVMVCSDTKPRKCIPSAEEKQNCAIKDSKSNLACYDVVTGSRKGVRCRTVSEDRKLCLRDLCNYPADQGYDYFPRCQTFYNGKFCECATNITNGYQCVKKRCTACGLDDSACTKSAECCEGFECLKGTGTGSTCKNLQCTLSGKYCSSSERCCSGRCYKDRNNCVPATHDICGIQDETCSDYRSCCAGFSCIPNSKGTHPSECQFNTD